MAYAALRSLAQILHQTLNRDHQYLTLDEKQQIESLIEKVSSLQDFLENSSKKIKQHFERKIRDASYIAEDIIESHITDRILSESASHEDGILEKMSKRFNLIEKWIVSSSKPASSGPCTFVSVDDFMDIKGRLVSSSKPASSGPCTFVRVDDFMDIKARLVRKSSELEIASIVGMSGIGKTTLAKQVYHDPYIINHFQIRAWATVSHNYNVQEILLSLLNSMGVLTSNMHEMTSELLKERFYTNLNYQRYLIVLDDVWDTKFWDDVKQLFPNYNIGSRIMMTTRLGNVANYANSCPPLHRMRFLSDSESWILFCEKVFGNYYCHLNLEEIGEKIVQHCQGLPLATVLIGGLLSKATRTEHYWEYVAENISLVTTSIDEQCSNILSFSYKHLPSHLKWCFLYMGIFPEDYNIHVSKLVKLWVAEGIVKPVGSKLLEDVAEEYFLDLVERELILIHEKKSNGKIKTCRIHDFVRDLCVREAQKEKFFHVTNRSLRGIQEGSSIDRVSIHRNTNTCDDKILSSPHVRSLLNFDCEVTVLEMSNMKLLKVLHQQGTLEFSNEIAEWVELRYLDCISMHLPSISKLQNLQTIILRPDMRRPLYLSLDIWKMPQLRHVLLEYVILPDPSSVGIEGDRSVFVLENLQTLSLVMNFRCTEEVIKRIPNIKKLGIHYKDEEMDMEYYCLNNLVHLHKLESLKLTYFGFSFSMNLSFPTSLKKLTLVEGGLSLEDISIVGSLPNLQVLKLRSTAFFRQKWITNAGEFLQLKYLLLQSIALAGWRVDPTPFPSLECLVLKDCYDFVEIPDEIREIPTLRSIEIYGCGFSVLLSAMDIQRRSGNDGLQVLIDYSRIRI
ncbi:putative disease resistance RPP8-like protein 4 [Abeliophyllum distichum]|uniref:Disease resistance RPP8-like protein 4 n=1 Tax=Abeliophyllum distichum TaxID=126358 RepID=A0ABD1NT96_9LAMI